MKGFIDTDGDLSLMRGPRFVVQLCPFPVNSREDYCGDYCPHFGEPYKHKQGDYTRIHLTCGNSRTLVLEDFEDKRIS